LHGLSLRGPLSAQVCRLTSLTVLDLRGNRFCDKEKRHIRAINDRCFPVIQHPPRQALAAPEPTC